VRGDLPRESGGRLRGRRDDRGGRRRGAGDGRGLDDAARAERRRRRTRRALIYLLTSASALALALGVVYVERRQIARQAVGQWLAARGVPSETSFAALGPGRLVGRIRIGRPDAPDLTVERAEVRYSLLGLARGRGVTVTEVRLTHPVLKAKFAGGRFTAGALDPVIDELLRQPPKPGEPHPRIVIDDGRAQLSTDYGVLVARVWARVEDNRLVALDAVTAPGRFGAAGVTADLGAARLQARTSGGRISLGLRAPVVGVSASGGALRAGDLTVGFEGAYPDLERKTPIIAQGWANLTAAAGQAKGVSAGPLKLSLQAPRLVWLGDRGPLAGEVEAFVGLQDVTAGALKVAVFNADAHGPFNLGPQPQASLVVRGAARGGWSGLGAPVGADSREIAAVKRAALAFSLSAEGLTVAAGPDRLDVRLTAPLTLRPQAGGEARLAPLGAGYRLTSAGGGLPAIQADLRRVSLASDGGRAELSAHAALSIAPVEQADVTADGVLTVARGQASFAASRCVEVKAARIMLGQTPLEAVSGRLCPLGAPMLRAGQNGWSVAARVEGAAAAIPAQQVMVEAAAADVAATAKGRDLEARLDKVSAKLADTTPEPRFRPFIASGRGDVARDQLSGAFDARLADGPVFAHADVRQDIRNGEGSARFATPKLRFAPGGLQPSDLSPLAAPLGESVDGAVEFTGDVRWTAAGLAGRGRLVVPGLDFKSAAGQVSGLSGEIAFTSLMPLIAPPGQTVQIRAVDAPLRLTDVSAKVGLEEKRLVLTDGVANAGGGHVALERLEVPLEPGKPLSGALRVDDVELHDVVEASPFGDKVDFTARVAGRIPFVIDGEEVSIAGGDLHAIAPGRLSIKREVLTGLSTEGVGQAASATGPQSPDAVTDMAYQALENLAFEKLDAGLTTRPDGRLAALFHIVGRHDPPQHQEIAISWTDLIRRRFVGRKLPLPSDTGVDLTLDTSLNLNGLLRDYADYQRLRSKPPAKAPPGKETTMVREKSG
jgi:hypothetical protein